jgi:hypothetical protein
MSSAKLAVASGLAALALSACGSGGSSANRPHGRGVIDDPRTTKNNHVQCLQQRHLQVKLVGNTGLQIGSAPSSATVVFEPTPGSAQAGQIASRSQGAEVIGNALVYPNGASESDLSAIEDCLTKGVTG